MSLTIVKIRNFNGHWAMRAVWLSPYHRTERKQNEVNLLPVYTINFFSYIGVRGCQKIYNRLIVTLKNIYRIAIDILKYLVMLRFRLHKITTWFSPKLSEKQTPCWTIPCDVEANTNIHSSIWFLLVIVNYY